MAYVPTEDDRVTVALLASYGLPHDAIATVMGIDPNTLRHRCGEELKLGKINANLAVAKNLFRMATSETDPKALTAAIFWLKAQAGWREAPQEVEFTDKTPADRTDDERAKAMALMLAKRAANDHRRTG